MYAKITNVGESRTEIRFSRHAEEKLRDAEGLRLSLTGESIRTVLEKPECIDNDDFPILMAIGKLTDELSLCVVYKFVDRDIRVITFFPARRGRYESKVLPGR